MMLALVTAIHSLSILGTIMADHFGQKDSPITRYEEEYLGLGDYVEALSDFILECDTPLTISIQGDWGTGKTSMMNLVRERLEKGEGDKKVATFWFNTWQFSQFSMQDDVAISLLSNLLDELSSDSNTKKFLQILPRKAIGYFSQTMRAAVDITVGGGGDGVKEALEKFAENALGSDSDPAKQIIKIKEAFKNAVAKQLVEKNARRLIVFVDDLDRLAPEKAVELLEVIKLFLDVEKCVFVLAVDYNVVSQGLEKKFGSSINNVKGKSFFDKIIQLPFNLPVSQYKTRDYLQQLFEQNTDISKGKQDLGLYEHLTKFSIGNNPRTLKRLFNNLQLLEMVAKKREIMKTDDTATAEERYRILFAVMCLQLAYPAVYELIIKQGNALDGKFLLSMTKLDGTREGIDADNLKKTLGGLEEEGLDRFRRFMLAFNEAMQLKSRKEASDEHLVQAEIDVLLSFLSFSSLTVSSGESRPIDGQGLRQKQAITEFVERVLIPKYQSFLDILQTQLKYECRANQNFINFTFIQGAMNFVFAVEWLWPDNKDIIILRLWDPAITNASKDYAIDWFERELKEIYPTQVINKRKPYAYLTLQEYPLVQNLTEMDKLQAFKDMTDQALNIVLPKLADFYTSHQPFVQLLQTFTERLAQRLDLVFPAAEGWTIENNLRSLCREYSLKIYKATWNNKLSISLFSWGHHLMDIQYGIVRGNNLNQYDEQLENQTLLACQSNFKKEGSWSHVNWVFVRAALEYRSLTNGKSIFDLQYALTPEQENAALDYFVAELSKFRQIEAQLDALAASAQS